MALSDLEVFQEYAYSTFSETQDQQVDKFNDATRGGIVLTSGAHQGDFITRELTGSMDGDTVRLRSFIGEDSGDALSFTFNGQVAGGELSGTLDMGEYLGATWTAKRRTARGRR